ncbi:hypothetical protein HYPSUDRAFT_60262, partial [Hypholoma sublateritium FD-334 SS-4]
MASSSNPQIPSGAGGFRDLPALVPVATLSELPSTLSRDALAAETASAPQPAPVPVDARKTAIMHPQAGLVVSLNMTYVPRVTRHPLLSRNNRPIPYSAPRLVPDNEIYLAFLPLFPLNNGDLFGRLNYTNLELDRNVDRNPDGKYVLHGEIIDKWSRLEDALLDVADSLIRVKHDIPPIEWPELPFNKGYRNAHHSRSAAVSCAQRARDQFVALSAMVTLAISLHLEDNGDLQPVFAILRSERSRRYQPTSSAWWDLLSNSYICNFSPGFRVGAMVDARTTQWMPYVKQFAQARVPFWLLWGDPSTNPQPSHPAGIQYLPPRFAIEEARQRMIQTTRIVLPTYRFDPFAVAQAGPLSSSIPTDAMDTSGPEWAAPDVDNSPEDSVAQTDSTPSTNKSTGGPTTPPVASTSAHSASSSTAELSAADSEYEARKAKALGVLQDFLDGLASKREAHIANETPAARQSRESWEAQARKDPGFTKK